MEPSEVAMFTADVPALTAFYRELLDSDPTVASDGIAIFETDGVEFLIHETYEPDDGDLPAEDHLAYAVADVDEAFATLTDQGFTAFREPADHDWGRSAYLRDPDGRLVELAEE